VIAIKVQYFGGIVDTAPYLLFLSEFVENLDDVELIQGYFQQNAVTYGKYMGIFYMNHPV
jgi:hypothetical protein